MDVFHSVCDTFRRMFLASAFVCLLDLPTQMRFLYSISLWPEACQQVFEAWMVGAMCACVVKVRFESDFRVKDNSQDSGSSTLSREIFFSMTECSWEKGDLTSSLTESEHFQSTAKVTKVPNPQNSSPLMIVRVLVCMFMYVTCVLYVTKQVW